MDFYLGVLYSLREPKMTPSWFILDAHDLINLSLNIFLLSFMLFDNFLYSLLGHSYLRTLLGLSVELVHLIYCFKLSLSWTFL